MTARKKPAKKARRPAGAGSEKALHMACKQWLDKAGFSRPLLIFHVANERKGGIGAAMHFKRMGVLPGVADWLAFQPGRAVAIELKNEAGKQDADQKKFQRQWEAAGNAYYVVRTLAEFQAIINGLVLFS